jgi:hypothetical protein
LLIVPHGATVRQVRRRIARTPEIFSSPLSQVVMSHFPIWLRDNASREY